MNIKKRSIIIPAFALLIGAALAGSVTGTVAWYQYSTRVNAAYVGTSVGASGNLQIRFAGQGEDDWATRLTFDDVDDYLYDAQTVANIIPVTSGDMEKDDALPTALYANPICGVADYANWAEADAATNYVVLPLEIRFNQKDETTPKDRNLYLTDLLIQQDPTNSVQGDKDISDAIRVHIACDNNNFLISNKGETIDTHGALDLDGDGENDKAYGDDDKYGFNGGQYAEVDYGEGTQEAYEVDDIVVASGTDGVSIDDADKASKVLGVVPAQDDTDDDEEYLEVTITIWVEGWQEFGEGQDASSIWDIDYIGSWFDVGMEFAIDPAE